MKTLWVGLLLCSLWCIGCSDVAGSLQPGDATDTLPSPVEPPNSGTGDGNANPVVPSPKISGYAWDNQHSDAPNWARFAEAALRKQSPLFLQSSVSDMASFCPRYGDLNSEDRIIFWIGFLAALAKSESHFDPDSFEIIEIPSGQIVKRGLLRIDINRADIHECEVARASDLNSPEVNFECSAKVLSYWVLDEKQISGGSQSGGWRGAARIWPSLRDPQMLDSIQFWTRNHSVCRD